MSDDYNNRPAHLLEELQRWMEEQKTRRPFLLRVQLWLFTPLLWRSTKWSYPSIYGISTETFPNWGKR